MLGTMVNTVAILFGGGLGNSLKSKISKRYSDTLLNSIGLTVIFIGLKSAFETNNILLLICSMALGSIAGEFFRIEDKLDYLGELLEKKFNKQNGYFAEGFVTGTLIYCVGAMSIIGAIENGVSNNHSTLFAKSILDGISSLVFSSTLGIGIALSAVPVLIYQGSITLLSSYLANYISMEALNEISAIGGLLVMTIGLNVLKITKIKVGNMLPAIFIPVIFFLIRGLLV